MYKVYLDLKNKIIAVFGKFLSSDETYMYLQDGPVIRMLPLEKIAHIEDLTDVRRVSEPVTEKVARTPSQGLTRELPASILEPGPVIPPPPPPISDVAEFRNKLKSKKDKESLSYQPDTTDVPTMVVNVVVSGAEDKSMQIEVPTSSFVPNQYSPTLAKELAKNIEMKAILENGIIFDGPPQVIGTNVYIKTKRITDTMSNVADKMGMLSKLNNITSGFTKPHKTYVTDFSTSVKTAIAGSPFEQPILISEDDNAYSSAESSAGQEENRGDIPDRDSTIHDEGQNS